MTNHTPGPWHSHGSIVYNAAGWAICNAIIYHGNFGQAETQANATLISAAPELLEALKACLEDLESFPVSLGMNFCKGAKLAQAAIAKAEGLQ